MSDEKQGTIRTSAVRRPVPLYLHKPRPHGVINANLHHKEELQDADINTRLAVALTKSVGTMWTAYGFALLAIVGLLAILGWLSPVVALLVAWVSQTFLQLCLLPIIMVGQNVLGHKAELQGNEAFKATMNSYHDIEQVMAHLDAQDAKILEVLQRLETQQLLIVRLYQSQSKEDTPS